MGTTPAQKKLFYNLRRLKAKYGEYADGDLAPETVAAIARDLAVSEHEVGEMNRRLGGGDYSLNDAPPSGEPENEFLDFVADGSEGQESALADADEMSRRRELVGGALAVLNERERDILTQRRLRESPPTLEVLSRRYGVSRERIRQIEVRAFQKLQKAVRSRATAPAGPA
jgi:RNA polymerase sigma-32 factor